MSSACSQRGTVNKDVPSAITVADTAINHESQGLITVPSIHSVSETSDRLEKIIQEKGLTLFIRIDHSANAVQVGEELSPTQLLIFGNPKVGTPLMKCSATTAIDLPQKFLVLQDNNQQTLVIYNSPQYLQQRHKITGCDDFLAKVSGVLESIANTATK
ncbi:MAG: DUF302 domain-containing protein [Cyanobacteria bacterium P01_G01_bin.67]